MMISLIVATLGRTDELAAFLASLKAQTYRNWELIVVDQNEDDRVVAVLSQSGLSAKHLKSPRGASRGRNVGLAAASGDIVAIPDDDCTYEPETLENLVRFLTARPEVGAVIGRWAEKDCAREEINRFNVFRRAGTCFYFVRREWTERIGRFDEEFGPGPDARYQGGEDTDYLVRGMMLGMKIVREPKIRIHHPDMSVTVFAAAKVRAYGQARMALLRKHGYPLWFHIANVVFPLVQILRHPYEAGYYWNVFIGRCKFAAFAVNFVGEKLRI